MTTHDPDALFTPLTLPNGVALKNRLIKSAMSDSLGDGRGNPTEMQRRLYERWARGGAAAAIVGEVQGDPRYAEKPGNLVLDETADGDAFRALAHRGSVDGTGLWLQLGHAGALAHPPIGTPRGPSDLDLPELKSAGMSRAEIADVPTVFAATAQRAQALGFGGVQIHAAHGFLLSQFLSPLFNRRSDAYGGPISHRMRLLIETVQAVRAAVDPGFVVALKLNATDQLEGGLAEDDALRVVAALDGKGLDLLDISGGTYFPGAASSSDRASSGPYFLGFARAARAAISTPVMATGGFKQRAQAEAAIASGDADAVGLARALVLDPSLPRHWQDGGPDPAFPKFTAPLPGGVTAWYTMRLTDLGVDREDLCQRDLETALRDYEARDAERVGPWKERFPGSADARHEL